MKLQRTQEVDVVEKLNLLGKLEKAGTNKELLFSALSFQKLDSLRDVYCVSKTVAKDG